MVQNKKDKMDEQAYTGIKKHPVARNPILMSYVATLIVVAVAAVILYIVFK